MGDEVSFLEVFVEELSKQMEVRAERLRLEEQGQLELPLNSREE